MCFQLLLVAFIVIDYMRSVVDVQSVSSDHLRAWVEQLSSLPRATQLIGKGHPLLMTLEQVPTICMSCTDQLINETCCRVLVTTYGM